MYAELKKHCANTQPARHRLPELVRLQASVSIQETGAGAGVGVGAACASGAIAPAIAVGDRSYSASVQRLSPHHQLAHPVSPNADLSVCETLGALQREQASLQAGILSCLANVPGAAPPVPPHKTHSLSGQLSALATVLPNASFAAPSTANANANPNANLNQSLSHLSSSASLSSTLQPAELKYWLSVALEVRSAKSLPRAFQRGAACTLFVRDTRIKMGKTQYCECQPMSAAGGGGAVSAQWSLEEFTLDDVPFDVDSFALCVHHPKGKSEGLWLSRRFAEFAPGCTHYVSLPLQSAKSFQQALAAAAAAADRLSPSRLLLHKQSHAQLPPVPFAASAPLDERPQISIRLQYMVDIAMPIEEYVGYRDVRSRSIFLSLCSIFPYEYCLLYTVHCTIYPYSIFVASLLIIVRVCELLN